MTLVWKEPNQQAVERGDAHQPGFLALQLAQIALQQFELVQGRLGVAQGHRAGGGQPQPVRQALEQREAEFLFQLVDLPADGRTGHMQFLGSGADRAGLRHGGKIAQNHCMHALPGPLDA